MTLEIADPIQTTWATDSNLFSMLQRSENGYRWIIDRYILVYCRTMESTGLPPTLVFLPEADVFTTWENCPFLEIQRLRGAFVEHLGHSFVDFTRAAIDQGYYVYAKLNQEHIGKSREYLHKTFFYGYEDDLFFVADHFENFKYCTFSATFDGVEKAFKSAVEAYQRDRKRYEQHLDTFLDWIVLIGYRDAPYNTNIARIRKSLLEYRRSFSEERIRPDVDRSTVAFGVATYEHILAYIHALSSKTCDIFDNRIFTLIRDHKAMMVRRARLLLDSGVGEADAWRRVRDTYIDLQRRSEALVYLFLLYQKTFRNSTAATLRRSIIEIRAIETAAIDELIEATSASAVGTTQLLD